MAHKKNKVSPAKIKSKILLWKIKNTSPLESELLNSVIILKNLSLVEQSKPLSADFIFQTLMDNSFFLKPVYGQMLNLYRMGRDDEAFGFFAEMVGTKSGKTFSNILYKLDKINPAELGEQLEILKNILSEKRVTGGMRKVQRRSIFLSLWATATVFALLINFSVVVVFLDAVQMLRDVF